MRVLMLGWEFPPFISGGLGAACHGLTRALSEQDVGITFVLPKAVGRDYQSHVELLSPQAPEAAAGDRGPASVAAEYRVPGDPSLEGVRFKAVPAGFANPYAADMGQAAYAAGQASDTQASSPAGSHSTAAADDPAASTGEESLIRAARRYADLCRDLARGEAFDLIHAHDWLTFPAAIAVARDSGKPLIVHVHSTEYDRAGEQGDPAIVEQEQQGFAAADRIIAVSYYTHSVLEKRYEVDPDKMVVVHNGLDQHPQPGGGAAVGAGSTSASRAGGAPSPDGADGSDADEKTVLFLGRITQQKGPEYFIEAARKVLARHPQVKFLMAGCGDRMEQVIHLAADEGIENRVVFTGFLHGGEVERAYRLADLFVMPSVSEPFGLATLEAMSHEVPVIVSRTSGVSEVVSHALKVDFWNTDELAEKILAVLSRPELGRTMTEEAGREVKKLTWAAAAQRCRHLYHELTAAAG